VDEKQKVSYEELQNYAKVGSWDSVKAKRVGAMG
jgi:hypothetical protein